MGVQRVNTLGERPETEVTSGAPWAGSGAMALLFEPRLKPRIIIINDPGACHRLLRRGCSEHPAAAHHARHAALRRP